MPLVKVGQAVGSVAITRVFLPFVKFWCKKGKANPAKLLPPPAEPIIMSGYSPAISICLSDSSPITDWCVSTGPNTDPNEYLYFPLDVTAASTASEMAIPKEPGVSGSSASTF